MPKTRTSFGQPDSPLKKAIENSTKPEVLKKRGETKHANCLIKNAIYEQLKADMLANEKNGKTYYSIFLEKYLKRAKDDPDSKAAAKIAEIIFHEDILEMLDEEQNKQMARDMDFLRYRAIKRLFKEQRDVVLDVDKRKKLVMCSRRAGKTDDNSTNLIYTCITPNSPCLYVNKTFRNAIDQMWQLCEDQATEIGLEITDGTSKAEGMMVFTNGSSIKFSGNSNDAEADKLRGGKYRLVIIDEAGHQRNMKYLVDEVLSPALMDYEDSIMVLSGTPPRVPHTYVEKCWNESGWEKYHWTMHRNPYIHNVDEEIDRICKEKGLSRESSFIQREYFGKMGAYDREAMVFGKRTTVEHIDAENLDIEPTGVVLGVDFGFSDYNGIVTVAYNKDTRESRVIAQAKFNKATISEIVESIKMQYELAKKVALKYNINLANVSVFCDNNEKSIVAELSRNYGIRAYCAWKYDKATAIEQLAEEMRTGRMVIEEHSFIDDEADQILYKRDDATDAILPVLDEDLGIHPDIIMALLYASRQMFLDFGYSTGGESKDKKEKDNAN